MTNEPENNQQNVVNEDRRGKTPGARQAQFKPGYDPKRWIKGRGKLSPEQKEGEKILLAVIWEELSREFDTGSMKPLETPETVDALRLMVRTWIKKRPELIAERIAGKVIDKHEFGGMDGKDLVLTVRKASDIGTDK